MDGRLGSPDFDSLRSEILELHRRSIAAHFGKDVDCIVQGMSDDFMSVSRGEIRYPSREEQRTVFTEYLNSTRFTEYRDLCEPVIGFSEDGSMAWSVVQVKVAGFSGEGESEKAVDFVCAWMTLYRRVGGGWERLSEVSTFK
ncbi:hypothetical protein JXL21_11305 [Candidatus Bathyarchaeota archaeon]|nr:hypothetical protein [Candidatus Bathyarchaeota archaeon]